MLYPQDSEHYNLKTKLRKMRVARDLTQKQLGEKLGIDASTISRFEKGEMMPSAEELQTLADFFGLSIDYLLDDENKRFYLATIHVSGILTDTGFIDYDADVEAFIPPYAHPWDIVVYKNDLSTCHVGSDKGDYIIATNEVPYFEDSAILKLADGTYDFATLLLDEDNHLIFENEDYSCECSDAEIIHRLLCTIHLKD